MLINSSFTMSRVRQVLIILLVLLASIYLIMKLSGGKNEEIILPQECIIDGKFELKNILKDEEKLLKSDGKQIFFIESHLEEQRELKNAKKACSIESAGKNELLC